MILESPLLRPMMSELELTTNPSEVVTVLVGFTVTSTVAIDSSVTRIRKDYILSSRRFPKRVAGLDITSHAHNKIGKETVGKKHIQHLLH